MTELITDDEILQLLELATGTPERDDIFKENPEYACRGWMTYAGVRPGTIKITQEALWEAASAFFERKGIPLPDYDLWALELASRLSSDDMGIDTVFYCDSTLPSICHLSAPTGQAWHGIRQNTMRANVREFVDQDYIHRLSERDKLWLSKFNDEYYNNRFRNNETDFHQTQTQKRERFRNTNAMNRDTYAVLKAGRALKRTTEALAPEAWTPEVIEFDKYGDAFDGNEDALIEYIDGKKFAEQLWEGTALAEICITGEDDLL